MDKPPNEKEQTAPLLRRLQKYTIYVSFIVAVGRELKTASLLEKALNTVARLSSENEKLRDDNTRLRNENTEANSRFTRLTDRLYPKGSYGNTDSLLVPPPVSSNEKGAPSAGARN